MSTTPLRREIDGTLYELELWDTDTALDWQQRLMQLGLDSVGQMLSDTPEGATIDDSRLATVARTLTRKLQDQPVPQLLKGMLSHVWIITSVQGKEARQRLTDPGTWKTAFAGKLLTAHKLAWWVLEVNLKDFIDAARSYVADLQQLWQSVSKLMPGAGSNESDAAVEGSSATPAPSSP